MYFVVFVDFLLLFLSFMCWDLKEFNLLVFKATSRKKKYSLLPLKIDSANLDFPCWQRNVSSILKKIYYSFGIYKSLYICYKHTFSHSKPQLPIYNKNVL